METLGIIFGSKARVRLIRLFLLNPDRAYTLSAASDSANVSKGETERELRILERAGLLRRRLVREALQEGTPRRLKRQAWVLDRTFIYLTQLQNLLVNTALLRSTDLVRRLSRVGSIRLIVIAGVFLQQWESRVDLLLVADKVRKSSLERVIRSMETEIGKELRYALLTSADFSFRYGMGDRLIRDVFDFPHHVIFDKIGLK